MVQPIEIEVDRDVSAAYVRYCTTKIVGTIDVWHDGQVAADVDSDGCVVGIELLGFDSKTLIQARNLARIRGLAFPESFPVQ